MKTINKWSQKAWFMEIQLTVAINFMSSKDDDEKHKRDLKSDNIETMNHENADEVMEELFESILNRYQVWKHQWDVLILSLI